MRIDFDLDPDRLDELDVRLSAPAARTVRARHVDPDSIHRKTQRPARRADRWQADGATRTVRGW